MVTLGSVANIHYDKREPLHENSFEAFSEIVRGTVLQTLANCSVEGKMQGKAKINFDVAGYVTAQFTCDVEADG